MKMLFLFIAFILILGLVNVLLPWITDVYERYRYRKVVTCPEARTLAEVTLQARRAALTSIFKKPVIHVKSCSLWPRRKGCGEACAKENWPSP